MKVWSLVLVAALSLASLDADAARRLGGGRSVGQQSSNVTQREAAKPAPGAPQQASPSAQPGAAGAAAAVPAKRPWGAMLGGLAAGLGLAWLASSLGLGAAFGQFLLFALLALVVMLAVGWFIRSRRQSAPAAAGGLGGGLAYQGAGASAATPTAYRPDQVGNDASARPWERNSTAFEAHQPAANSGSMIGSGLAAGAATGVAGASGLSGAQNWSIPAGFDVTGFVNAAKGNFIALQVAWDQSDIGTLRAMMTDAMLAEIKTQLAEREAQSNGKPNHTEVAKLEAQLLGIEEQGSHYMASVEFSGLIQEDPSSGPSPFREVWNMTKPRDGSSGWLVAGVQAFE